MTLAQPVLKVGDRIVITMIGSKYRGKTGTVLQMSAEAGFTTYTVELDLGTAQMYYQRLDLKHATLNLVGF